MPHCPAATSRVAPPAHARFRPLHAWPRFRDDQLRRCDGAARRVESCAAGPPPLAPEAAFRSALCFWEDEALRGGVAVEAGPWAIAEYLEYPEGSRFLQSFKSVAASTSFEHATVFEKRYRFEDLGRLFLDKMAGRANGALVGATRIVVGRPVVLCRPSPR